MKFVDRRNTECIKYSKKAIEGLCGNPEALPFWIADMDFASPEAIGKAVNEQTSVGVYGYHTVSAVDAFLAWCRKRHNYKPSEDLVVPSFGILNSIAIMVECLEGDMIVPSPTYRPFRTICQSHNRQFIDWELKYDKNKAQFSLDFEKLEKIVEKPGKKIMTFCSPQNPSGLVFSHEELTKVALICKKYNIPVLCDEIHCDMFYPGEKHIPFDVVAHETGIDCVTFMAPSKTFNIAGEHYSITIFSNERLKNMFVERKDQLCLESPSLMSTIAAKAGYEKGYDWICDLTKTLKENADFIDSYLKKNCPILRFVKPRASFIAFIDCSELVKKHPEISSLSHFFGKEAGIAVNDGPWFGEQYSDFVRFNFATDRNHITDALNKMSEAINKLK